MAAEGAESDRENVRTLGQGPAVHCDVGGINWSDPLPTGLGTVVREVTALS